MLFSWSWSFFLSMWLCSFSIGVRLWYYSTCNTCWPQGHTTLSKLNVKFRPSFDELLPYPSYYRQLVGRLDITFAVHIVGQFVSTPSSTHYATVFRFICSVRGSLQLGFFYLSTFIAALQAYTDANWASDIIDRCSLTGFFLFFFSRLFPHGSQKIVNCLRSSTEA